MKSIPQYPVLRPFAIRCQTWTAQYVDCAMHMAKFSVARYFGRWPADRLPTHLTFFATDHTFLPQNPKESSLLAKLCRIGVVISVTYE